MGEHLWAYELAKDAARSQARFTMAAQCWRKGRVQQLVALSCSPV